MTDEEKEKYRDGLIATCKVYCHIDYDDDMRICLRETSPSMTMLTLQ